MDISEVNISVAKTDVITYFKSMIYSDTSLNITEKQTKLNAITQRINTNALLFNPIEQSGLTNSIEFNSNNDDLFIDLLTMFKFSDQIDQFIDRHISINNSTLNLMNNYINKLNTLYESYETMYNQRFNPIHYMNDFSNNDDIETDPTFYGERYGEQVPLNYHCKYDTNSNSITLPTVTHINTLYNDKGVSFTTVSLYKQLCQGLNRITSEVYSIDNIIDNSQTTYWSETILSYEKIAVTFDDKKVTGSNRDYYYGINNGAMAEIEINYDARTIVNEVTIKPCSQFPIEILAIRYTESDDPAEDFSEIVFPGNTISELGNVMIDGSISYKFQNVLCKRLYILFRQIHYKRAVYNYNPSDVIKNEIWFNSNSDGLIKSKIQNLFKPLYNDNTVMNKILNYIDKIATMSRKFNISDILFSTAKNKNIIKYQYNYGFYNINAFQNDFNMSGFLVTKPIYSTSNIRAISLNTEESHQLTSNGFQYTDIEYYITSSETPTYLDWIPILPNNIDTIPCELLQLSDNECNFRFNAAVIYSVYNNRIALIKNIDYWENTNDLGIITGINIPNFDSNAIYTASYKATDEAHTVEFIQNNNVQGISKNELIKCNGQSFYELSEIPFNYKLSNTVLDIIDKTSGLVLSEANGDIECVTNIINPEDSYESFKQDGKIQYYIKGDCVYMNKTYNDNYYVDITYSSFVSHIRLKAIMRKNVHGYDYLTCELNKIDVEIYNIE